MIAVDSIVKYGRGLVYDSVYGAADSQRVDFATGKIGSGDWAIIQPEKGAWALDEKDVVEGRIIARIRSHAVYAPFEEAVARRRQSYCLAQQALPPQPPH